MKEFNFILNFITIIYIITLIGSFTVEQNITWLSSNVPLSSVKNYASGKWMSVYGVYWCLRATDYLRIFYIFIPYYCVIKSYEEKTGYSLIVQAFSAFFAFIVEGPKCFWTAYNWANCPNVDFCRSYDSSALDTSTDVTPNYVFYVIFSMTLVSLIYLGFIAWLGSKLNKQMKKESINRYNPQYPPIVDTRYNPPQYSTVSDRTAIGLVPYSPYYINSPPPPPPPQNIQSVHNPPSYKQSKKNSTSTEIALNKQINS